VDQSWSYQDQSRERQHSKSGLKAVKTASKGAEEAGAEGLELNARYMEPVARVREMQ
jgi:hypothetical protein